MDAASTTLELQPERDGVIRCIRLVRRDRGRTNRRREKSSGPANDTRKTQQDKYTADDAV